MSPRPATCGILARRQVQFPARSREPPQVFLESPDHVLDAGCRPEVIRQRTSSACFWFPPNVPKVPRAARGELQPPLMHIALVNEAIAPISSKYRTAPSAGWRRT